MTSLWRGHTPHIIDNNNNSIGLSASNTRTEIDKREEKKQLKIYI